LVLVAPRTGAWIETFIKVLHDTFEVKSHPARVRGLKLSEMQQCIAEEKSHPARVRGLKQICELFQEMAGYVAPRTGAWIETFLFNTIPCIPKSHPARVRGLKQFLTILFDLRIQRRTPHGCVD